MTKLPRYVFIDDSSLSRLGKSNVIRSEMEVGPAKTRPLQSVPLFECKMTISISSQRLGEFRAWFRNEIGSGAYWFLMKDPFDGTLRRFRFVETEIEWQKSGTLMRTSVSLEAYDEL